MHNNKNHVPCDFSFLFIRYTFIYLFIYFPSSPHLSDSYFEMDIFLCFLFMPPPPPYRHAHQYERRRKEKMRALEKSYGVIEELLSCKILFRRIIV